jgi:hypothetical protein
MVARDFFTGGLCLKRSFILAGVLFVSIVAGCARENEYSEPEQFSFVVYPGARYLGQLSDLTKQAHKLIKPNEEPPPVAIYDTDASVEDVATFYAKSYGYGTVAPDATNNLSAAKPAAYYRTGDLAVDNRGAQEILAKLNVNADVSKASGTYKAAEIEAKPNRPRVTIQRPYFDVTKSQTVDRTLILMSR